jgi:hypothetical protein
MFLVIDRALGISNRDESRIARHLFRRLRAAERKWHEERAKPPEPPKSTPRDRRAKRRMTDEDDDE